MRALVGDHRVEALRVGAQRESEQRYELAMAASESGYWDWHFPTGRYFASPRAYELIREVRGIRSAMPVVLMSGYLGPTADKVRESSLFQTLGVAQKIAAAIGADEVLQKPLSARDLAASLARVLRL